MSLFGNLFSWNSPELNSVLEPSTVEVSIGNTRPVKPKKEVEYVTPAFDYAYEIEFSIVPVKGTWKVMPFSIMYRYIDAPYGAKYIKAPSTTYSLTQYAAEFPTREEAQKVVEHLIDGYNEGKQKYLKAQESLKEHLDSGVTTYRTDGKI